MNPYKIGEMALCLCAVLLGVLYLYTELLTLSLVLPLMTLFFIGIPVLRYLDGKKRGLSGLALYLPVICMGLVALTVGIAWGIYAFQY